MPITDKKIICAGAVALALAGAWAGIYPGADDTVVLPPPRLKGDVSLEEALTARRSVRQFSGQALTPAQVGQLCWAAQGITDPAAGRRTAPSAGALYPIELYVVTTADVSVYDPRVHRLMRRLAGDVRPALSRAALGQESVARAPVCFVVAAVVERTARKYGERAERYCLLEAGHVAQNILLQATALGLVGVPIGAFNDDQVADVLKLPKEQRVLYLLPVGWPAGRGDEPSATQPTE